MCRHFVELLGIKEHKIALFYVTLYIPISLRLCQIAFANDTYAKIIKILEP